MIDILEKSKCCGCNACGDICPKNSIKFNVDIEGFWYPVVNKETCIDCGLCENICPTSRIPIQTPQPQATYAAINKNMSVRWNSTSGGLFSVFAEEMYSRGGYVGGAVYNQNFTVSHFVSNNTSDLQRLRSSKYLQSNAEGFYKKVKELLISGHKVLVCGTPCQMAALKNYLNKEYNNLIILDFICRGVNSPKVYRSYLDSLEKKYGSKVCYVKAKNKELGWRSLTRKVVFEDGQSYYGFYMDDDFRRGYHSNVFCRPSCYECDYKGFTRVSDITLADCWNINKIDKNLDNDAGTSMLFINTQKGIDLFESVKDQIEYKGFDHNILSNTNDALFKKLPKPIISRTDFFKDLDSRGFEFVVNKYFPLSKKMTIKQRLFRAMSFLKIVKMLRLSVDSYINYAFLNLRSNTIRSKNKKTQFISMPGSVYNIDRSARIILNESIKFGTNPTRKYKEQSYLSIGPKSTLIVNDGPITRYPRGAYSVRSGAYIEVINGGTLTIGQGGSNHGLTIMCSKEVTIGNGVRIGRNVSIRDWNGPHVIVNETYTNHSPVHIGNHVWLCSGCTILPGVTIGDGCVVATNATVTKSVPEGCLVAGTPARIIKENIEWY